MPSDSNYAAVTRHRRPLSKSSRPQLEVVDDQWAADALSDDELYTAREEAEVAPLLDDGEMDADAVVVSPTGSTANGTSTVAERRRREESWNDLALDQIGRASSTSTSRQNSRSGVSR